MINLMSAATATPKHLISTTELIASQMHKLSPELINTISSLGVDQRYSVMDNYTEFLAGKKMNATDNGVGLEHQIKSRWRGEKSGIISETKRARMGRERLEEARDQTILGRDVIVRGHHLTRLHAQIRRRADAAPIARARH